MAYQVIARKWRPQLFSDVIGQDHISQTLLNALESGRLHHALLFTGPRGTGKTSSARVLAKALKCQKAKNHRPCNECEDCLEINLGRHVDVSEIDGASHNGVDAIRELRESVSYQSARGGYKLYIIDEVHMLSTSAFNALLKTLEEPPEHVLFVLATTELHKIPNTILSRCQRYDFRRIPTRKISEHLKNICQSDKVQFDERALWAIARQADGSMRDAQSLLDQAITFSEGQLSFEKVSEILGLTDRRLLTETLQALADRDVQGALDVAQKISQSALDEKLFLQDLLQELRHLLMVKLSGSNAAQLVDLSDTELEALNALANRMTEEEIHFLFDMALKGSSDILRSPDTRILLEMLLLRMAQAPRIQSLQELFKNPPLEVPASRRPPNEKKSVAPQPPPQVPKGDRWSELVTRIQGVNRLVAAKLEHTHLISLDGKSLVIGVPEKMKFLMGQIQDPDFQRKLTNYLATFWGPGFSFEVRQVGSVSAGPSPHQQQAETERKKEESIRQEVENHPMIKKTKELFNSQIRSIKENT